MLKNESAQNPTKPIPLRLSCLLDSGGIFTLSNGLRMEKISHFVQKFKQAKNFLLTVQSVQSVRPRGRPYHHDDMAEEGVAHCYWLVVVQSCDDTCRIGSK